MYNTGSIGSSFCVTGEWVSEVKWFVWFFFFSPRFLFRVTVGRVLFGWVGIMM